MQEGGDRVKKENRTIKNFISYLLCICVAILLIPSAVNAAEKTKLTLHYEAGATYFEFYKVAAFDETGVFELEEPFDNYVSTITGLDKLEEMDAEGWRELALTLGQVVVPDAIQPTKILRSDANGLLVWEGIPKGLYLLLGDETSDAEYTYKPSATFVIVPSRDEAGNWITDVEVNHNKVLKEEIIEYKDLPVLKIWEDTGHEKKRPPFIEVSLYNGDEKVDTVTLNEENNWKHVWEKLNADEEWSVKEEKVPAGYKVRYTAEGEGIYIINSYDTPNPPPNTPNAKTGQLWWPVPILMALGLLSLIIGVIRRRA